MGRKVQDCLYFYATYEPTKYDLRSIDVYLNKIYLFIVLGKMIF